ncbi:MAG: M23 family metallopeptidase [Fibrobacter sp.]|nr:M23 family metallopeptidase [Fibrobacter sp.]
MARILLSALVFLSACNCFSQWYVPANYTDAEKPEEISVTPIGGFGLLRKARPGVPAHYHTGIDIKRPGTNYFNEPVFPSYEGIVISVIDDGPFSQVVLKHEYKKKNYWTVYEHIKVKVKEIGKKLTPHDTLGYFFNRSELNRYGWQFDHFHFEVIKKEPVAFIPNNKYPLRRCRTYAITCYTKEQLDERLENPLQFLKGKLYKKNHR